jgi:quinol monooxygenase YgiN
MVAGRVEDSASFGFGGVVRLAGASPAYRRLTQAQNSYRRINMNVRVLHYRIKTGKLDEYLSLFSDVKERVAGMDGISFFKLFRDLEDPNILCLVAVFEDSLDLERYNEIGPNQEYTDAVTPLIEGFDMAMVYEVSAANPLYAS